MNTSNDYIYVRIPDLQPAGGPFVPAPAGQVTVAGRGSPKIPWPVLRHFLDAILASGDVVDDQEGLTALSAGGLFTAASDREGVASLAVGTAAGRHEGAEALC